MPCDTCSNGGVASGFIVDDNCACDCSGTGFEDATCETESLDAEGSASTTTAAAAAALAAAAVSALMLQ
jgi:hypothetical protein